MKPRLTNPLILIAALICFLLLAEGLLRLFGVGSLEAQFYRADGELGWKHRAGAQGWQRKEGEQLIRISSQGLRDIEHSLTKPDGTYRVAVLGDSFAAAFEVAIEDTFWKVAERELVSCEALNGKNVEFLNFGVMGYGTAQQLLQYRNTVSGYDPDFVVLAFLSGNDVFNNHPKLNPTNPELAPYFSLSDSGELIEPGGGSQFQVYWTQAVTSLRVAKLIDGAARRLRGENRSSREAELEDLMGKDFRDAATFRPPRHEYMQDAWAITEKLIEQLAKEVKEADRRFLFVSLTNSIQVHPDKGLQRKILRQARLKNFLYPDFRLKEFLRQYEVPTFFLVSPMKAYAQQNQELLHGFDNLTPGFGHWNVAGHRIAGELIAERMCRQLSFR